MVPFQWLANMILLVSNRFPDETSLSEHKEKEHIGSCIEATVKSSR